MWTTLLHILQPHLVCPQSPGTCFVWRTGCTEESRGFLRFLFLKQSKAFEFPHYKQTHSSSECQPKLPPRRFSFPKAETCKKCFRPLDSLGSTRSCSVTMDSVRFHSVTMDVWFQEALLCGRGVLGSIRPHSVTLAFWFYVPTVSLGFPWFCEVLQCHNGCLVPCAPQCHSGLLSPVSPSSKSHWQGPMPGKNEEGDIWRNGFCVPRAQ